MSRLERMMICFYDEEADEGKEAKKNCEPFAYQQVGRLLWHEFNHNKSFQKRILGQCRNAKNQRRSH